MLAALGLALLGSPFVTLPPLAHGDPVIADPVLMSVATDPARMRLHCFSTRCGDAEWRLALSPPPAKPRPSTPRKRAIDLPGSRRYIGLSAPRPVRQSRASYSNDFRLGTRVGVQALQTPDTRMSVQVGAGYRMMPLHDDGIGRPGAVFRGELNLGQRLGERTVLDQRVQWETGHGDMFIKHSLGVDVMLSPHWTLEADHVIRHREYGASGIETAESWMGLRRRF